MYISICLIGLVVSLSISSALDMWGLTYSVVLTCPLVGLSWFVRFYNEVKLEKLTVNKTGNKKKINSTSLIFSILSGLLYILPVLIIIIMMACNVSEFNPYMLLAIYILYSVGFVACTVTEYRKNEKQEQLQQQSKE